MIEDSERFLVESHQSTHLIGTGHRVNTFSGRELLMSHEAIGALPLMTSASYGGWPVSHRQSTRLARPLGDP
jgi:hypothetical protein